MTQKPTYEELEQKIKDLEQKVISVETLNTELQQSKELFEKTFISQRDAIFILNSEIPPKITNCNPAAMEMFGYTRQEFIGRTTALLHINEASLKKFQAKLYPAVDDNGYCYLHDFVMKRKDGTVFPTEHSVYPLQNKQGVRIGWVSVVKDITARKRAEETIQESEENFRALAENANDGILIAMGKGEHVYANKRAADITGYSVSELLKIKIKDLAHPNEFKTIKERYCAIISGKPFQTQYETMIISKDGNEVPIEVTSAQSMWHGQPVDIVLIRDISERKQIEEAFRESKERYRALAENSLVGIWQITLEGYTIYVNPAMCAILEIEGPEELTGQTYHSFFTPESLKIIKREYVKRLEGIGSSYEVEIIGKHGRKRIMTLSGAPLFSADGKFQSMIATFTDITERKQAEEVLQKAHDELERRVEERTKELNIKTKDLEELNAALKILLDKREQDKTELEEKILSNIKTIIEPYLIKVKKISYDQSQKTLINILESNLNEIISPFSRRLSSKYLNFSPSEIQVANLVKQGKTNKEIAAILQVASRTIAFHRENIRKKLGLKNTKTNLKTYLMTLE